MGLRGNQELQRGRGGKKRDRRSGVRDIKEKGRRVQMYGHVCRLTAPLAVIWKQSKLQPKSIRNNKSCITLETFWITLLFFTSFARYVMQTTMSLFVSRKAKMYIIQFYAEYFKLVDMSTLICALKSFFDFDISTATSEPPIRNNQNSGWNILVLGRIHDAINVHKSSWTTSHTSASKHHWPIFILYISGIRCFLLVFCPLLTSDMLMVCAWLKKKKLDFGFVSFDSG